MWVWSLGWEDPLEEGMATQSGILDWRIPWTGDPSRLSFIESQRVGHDWSKLARLHIHINLLYNIFSSKGNISSPMSPVIWDNRERVLDYSLIRSLESYQSDLNLFCSALAFWPWISLKHDDLNCKMGIIMVLSHKMLWGSSELTNMLECLIVLLQGSLQRMLCSASASPSASSSSAAASTPASLPSPASCHLSHHSDLMIIRSLLCCFQLRDVLSLSGNNNFLST